MPDFNRRELLTSTTIGSAAALAGAVFPASALAENADENDRPRQVPFYRTTLGDAEITIVSDGRITFENSFFFPDTPKEDLEAVLTRAYRPSDLIHLPTNAMVVDINGTRVLIDTGDGGKFQPTSGRLAGNLHDAGIDPASIDAVVFTHLHPDHLWGVTDAANEALIFPNARFIAQQDEHAFWTNPDLADQMPSEEFRQLTLATQAHLAMIEERLELVEAEALPGITMIPTPGHTPGHAALMMESAGETLLSLGDVITDPITAFEKPEWQLGVDFDPQASARTRAGLLDRLASDRQRSFGFHLPWPGLGHVGRDGDRYRWYPETWVM